MSSKMIFRQLFDYDSWTYTYLLADSSTREAVLIDTVKEKTGRDLALLKELGLTLKYILDTHIHADHITGAADLRKATGAKTGVSAVAAVSCADLALKDGDTLSFGSFSLKVMATPGHTDTCMSFYVDGMVFTGDTILIRDVGRTDFQQGSNDRMWTSITEKILALPDTTIIYPAHDYNGHHLSTVAEEKKYNMKVGGGKTKAQFVELMAAMKLAQPKKIHVAVPANLKCGDVNL